MRFKFKEYYVENNTTVKPQNNDHPRDQGKCPLFGGDHKVEGQRCPLNKDQVDSFISSENQVNIFVIFINQPVEI